MKQLWVINKATNKPEFKELQETDWKGRYFDGTEHWTEGVNAFHSKRVAIEMQIKNLMDEVDSRFRIIYKLQEELRHTPYFESETEVEPRSETVQQAGEPCEIAKEALREIHPGIDS